MERIRHYDQTGAGIARRPRGFLRDDDGSLIIFGLMIFLLMLTVGGLGVDLMRFEAQRARLQSTLDRAVLAAASLDQALDPEDVVLDYFEKAGLGAHISPGDITVVEGTNSRYVEVDVSMGVNATFLNFVGITELSAPAVGAAEEATSLTEISLVLDVSGSMGWSSSSGTSKIAVLRDAATKFINIVMCDPSNPNATTGCTVEAETVSVSLVPYSEQVLAGETLLGEFNVTDEHAFSSCVTFDSSDFNSTAITTSQELQRTGHFDAWSSRSSSASDWTCQTSSWRTITPVSGNAATLRSRIASLGAYGNTSIDVGMKWGAALLDPAAEPAISNLVDAAYVDWTGDPRPMAWNARGLEKVMVLMTDGVNTDQHYLYDAFREGPSPVWRNLLSNGSLGDKYSIYDEDNDRYYWVHSGSWEDHPYGTGSYQECEWVWVKISKKTGYWDYQCTEIHEEGVDAQQLDFVTLWKTKPWAWYEQFSWLDTQGSAYGNSTKNTRLDAMCDAAKAAGMTIFTIGFEVTSSSAAIMRDCASTPAHYFNANGLDLADAFSAIAREITKLRLVN